MAIDIDDTGRVFAFFIRSNGTNNIAQVAEKPAGGAWQSATSLSATGADVSTIDGAVSPSGAAIAVWQRGTQAQVSFKPAGGAWEAATTPAGATGTPQDSVDAAINGAGQSAAVWSRVPASTWLADLVFRPAAGPFAAPNLSVGSNANTDGTQPSVGIDGSGNATVLYRDWPPGSNGLKAKTRTPAGAITTATVVANASPSVSNSRIAVNEGGDAVAVWERTVGADTIIQASLRTGTGGAWNVTPIDLTAAGSGASTNPRVAIDQQGNALVTWTNGSQIHAASRAAGSSSFAAHPNVATGFQPDVALATQGNGAIAYNTNASPSEVKIAQFDPNPPAITAASFPSTGTTGTAVAHSAAATDFWDSSPDLVWDYGDGQSGPGNGSHVYSTGGSFTATLTATDDAGNAATQAFSVDVAAAPVISALRVSPTRFKPARRGASIAAAGAKVSYSSTLAASTTFTVQQPLKGVRKGSRCVAPPRNGGRGLKRCTRYKSLGSFKHAAKSGANSFRFTGRIKRKPLRVGGYRLSAKATASGVTGNTVTKSFRVKR